MFLVALSYQGLQFKQLRGAFLYLSAAESELDQGISVVSETKDAVRREAVSVAIMGHGAAERGGVNLQVSYAERLEDGTEGDEV